MNKITTNYMELEPAFCQPKTKKEAIAAWESGKDWRGDYTIGFALCSRRDFAQGTKVLLRYRNNTMVCEAVA